MNVDGGPGVVADDEDICRLSSELELEAPNTELRVGSDQETQDNSH